MNKNLVRGNWGRGTTVKQLAPKCTLEGLINYFSLTITHVEVILFRMLNPDQTCAVIMYAEGQLIGICYSTTVNTECYCEHL